MPFHLDFCHFSPQWNLGSGKAWEKLANFRDANTAGFPSKWREEEPAQKFHIDDLSLPKAG